MFLLALVLLLLAGAAVAWAERKVLLTWHCLHGLKNAEGDAVQTWAERTAALDEAVVPELLQMLGREESRACDNAGQTLACLVQRWGRDDPRCAELTDEVVKAFPQLGAGGQREALRLVVDWARPPCPEGLVQAAARLLTELAHHPDAACRARGLELALNVVRQFKEVEPLCPSRELARSGLRAAEVETRLRAIELASQPRVALQREVAKLLSDPNVEVRRAALSVVGPVKTAVDTDSLLPLLHDTDAGVRRLCESALRRRGLSSLHLRLARLISDPRWAVRLEVLDCLREAQDLDVSAWLRRLSNDSSPAVRVAAIRAACEDSLADLSRRIEEMAHQDPSPTVSELARYYLRQRKARPAGERE
jgi:hypothetical protein